MELLALLGDLGLRPGEFRRSAQPLGGAAILGAGLGAGRAARAVAHGQCPRFPTNTNRLMKAPRQPAISRPLARLIADSTAETPPDLPYAGRRVSSPPRSTNPRPPIKSPAAPLRL